MKRKELLLLFGIFLLGFILRVIYLGADSYWFDEANTIGFTQWPLGLFFKHYYVQRPVYFLILRVWVNLFGNGEFVTRLLSVSFGSLSILVLYKFVRLFLNKKIALLSSFILAVSFFHSLWSRTVMNYAFFCLISLISSYYFVKYLKFAHKRDLVLYCIASLISIFTHPFAVFLILVQNLLILHKRAFNLRWIVTQIFLSLGVILLCWALFFHPSFEDTYNRRIHDINRVSPQVLKQDHFLCFTDPIKLYETFTFGGRMMGHGGDGFPVFGWTLPLGYILLVVNTILLLLGLKSISDYFKHKENLDESKQDYEFKRLSLLYILLSIFIPMGVTFIAQFWIENIFCERYFIFSYPFFIVILSISIYKGIRLRWIRKAVIALTAILYIIYCINLYIPVFYQTWRNIVVAVKENLEQGDAIVLIPFAQITSFWFYFKRDDKNALYDKTMDGIYKNGQWVYSFKYDNHPVIGNGFKKIDSFIQGAPFKKLYSEKRNIWLVMSPYWEKVDRDAEKIYRAIRENYKRVFIKYYPFDGVSVEKWIMK